MIIHSLTHSLSQKCILSTAAAAAAALLQVIRSNETMSKAAALEQRILRLLADKDPDNRKHCIRLLRTFEYRQHVCMVFEPLVRMHALVVVCLTDMFVGQEVLYVRWADCSIGVSTCSQCAWCLTRW
jgi:hypothetical protein